MGLNIGQITSYIAYSLSVIPGAITPQDSAACFGITGVILIIGVNGYYRRKSYLPERGQIHITASSVTSPSEAP